MNIKDIQAEINAQQRINDDVTTSSPACTKPIVIGSQSLTVTNVIKIVKMLLDADGHISAHIEYMKYKKLTIVSKSYQSRLEWACLIGWCLAISTFLSILLIMVR